MGALAVIGSSAGVIRLLDISARTMVRVLTVHKLMKYPLDCIKFNEDQSMLAISSRQSKKIYFIALGEDFSMKILGYTVARDYVVTLEWLNSGQLLSIIGNHNYLLTLIDAPELDVEIKLEPL